MINSVFILFTRHDSLISDRIVSKPALSFAVYLLKEIMVDISNKTKLLVFACIIAVLVVGISVGGPKFINAIQMQFGSKGKIELIERCIDMPGCSIGPDDLDFYDRYHTIRDSEVAHKIKESKASR